MKSGENPLSATEEIVGIMEGMGLCPLVIGAVALAAHRYIRFTNDIDLAISIDLAQFEKLQAKLESEGFQTRLHRPDGTDPRGGVLDLSGPFGLVQIVNYGDRFPAAINDALTAPPERLSGQSPLRVIPLPHLVALKLYAGGLKSKADIVELLRRNPDADLVLIRALCASYGLEGFDEVLAELDPE